MSSREQMVAVVEEYLNCFSTKDLSRIPFTEDVTFEGPRMPRLAGRQMILGFLASILPMVKKIEFKQHIVEGDYVATLFDMETTEGVDHVFDLIHISDGKIKGVHAFYYPHRASEVTVDPS
jgi:ketosteroid isomerase-like protein